MFHWGEQLCDGIRHREKARLTSIVCHTLKLKKHTLQDEEAYFGSRQSGVGVLCCIMNPRMRVQSAVAFVLLLVPSFCRAVCPACRVSWRRLENTLNYGMERIWAISVLKGSNSVAFGFDEGMVVVKIGERGAHAQHQHLL